jgi:hypothetical protein
MCNLNAVHHGTVFSEVQETSWGIRLLGLMSTRQMQLWCLSCGHWLGRGVACVDVQQQGPAGVEPWSDTGALS